MAIGLKLANLLKARNKKPGTLASETGISKNTIYSIIKRNNATVNYSIIEKIAENLDVPVDYFFDTQKSNSFGVLPVVSHHVPILGAAACGEPIYKPGDGADYLSISDDDTGCDFALIAQGDSMTGDRIHDGDIVFFRAQDDVPDGSIAAVAIDDGVSIKRIKRLRAPDGTVLFTQLLSSNPAYDSIDIGGEDETRSVHVMGRAVAFRGELNK